MDFQLPPKIFFFLLGSGLETGRPLRDLEMLLTEPLLSHPGCVFQVIVILENPATTHLQCSY